MNNRLRVLSAALQLERFSVVDLVTISGVGANTVRTVLRRDADLFISSLGAPGPRTRGRPARRYRLVDAEKLQRLLVDVRDSVSWPEEHAMSDGPEDLTGAALDVAESAIRRAGLADSDMERRTLAAMAMRGSEHVLAQDDVDVDLSSRALMTQMQAKLLVTEVPKGPAGRQRLLHDLAALAARVVVLSRPSGLAVLRQVFQVSRQLEQAPPVGFIAPVDLRSDDVLAGARKAGWKPMDGLVAASGSLLWSPPWYEPLARAHALAGMVLVVPDTPEGVDIAESLSAVPPWVPKIVAAPESHAQLSTDAMEQGAMFLSYIGTVDTAPAIAGVETALDQRLPLTEHPDGSTPIADLRLLGVPERDAS